MKPTYRNCLAVIVFAFLPCTHAAAQCAAGGLAVVVNKANPTDSLSMAQLRKLIMGDVHAWPDQKKILLIARDPSSPVYKCVLSMIVRMSDSEYHRYVMNAEFRGEEPVQMKAADSGATAVKVVGSAPGSISVVETNLLSTLGPTVKVVRINGKQPGEAGYPL